MERQYLGEIDYRTADDVPAICPYCGEAVDQSEGTGSVYIAGPADLAWAAKHGITEEGWYRTRWHKWECVVDPYHYGPIAYGAYQAVTD